MQYQIRKEDAIHIWHQVGGDTTEVTKPKDMKVLTVDSDISLIYSRKRWHLFEKNGDVDTLFKYASESLKQRMVRDFGIQPERDQFGFAQF